MPQKCWTKIPRLRGYLRGGLRFGWTWLGRPAAASRRLGGRCDLPCAGGVWQQVGMSAEPVAGALDADDDGVVQKAIQQGGGDHCVTEDLAPFCEAAIRGQNHCASLVAGIYQLEE